MRGELMKEELECFGNMNMQCLQLRNIQNNIPEFFPLQKAVATLRIGKLSCSEVWNARMWITSKCKLCKVRFFSSPSQSASICCVWSPSESRSTNFFKFKLGRARQTPSTTVSKCPPC